MRSLSNRAIALFWRASQQTAQYTAHVDGESIPLLMRQEGLIRNAIIVFFFKDGKAELHARLREQRRVQSNAR